MGANSLASANTKASNVAIEDSSSKERLQSDKESASRAHRFVATNDASLCSSLIDVDLAETYQALRSPDFWTFHINFADPPAELIAQYPEADLASCFLLFLRVDAQQLYVPFDQYLLAPCYINESGNIPRTSVGSLLSSGVLHGGQPAPSPKPATLAHFDGQSYVRCEFNLAAFERQYVEMSMAGNTDLQSKENSLRGSAFLREELNFAAEVAEGKRTADWVEEARAPSQVLQYGYFAMAAAIAAVDVGEEDQSVVEKFDGEARLDDHLLLPPVSHPVGYLEPVCDESQTTLSSLAYDALYGISASEAQSLAAKEREKILNGGACPRSIHLDYMTYPDGTEDRVTLSANLMGLQYYPDWLTRGNSGCDSWADCFLHRPQGAAPGQYSLWRFGESGQSDLNDSCLTNGDDENANAYEYYFNVHFKQMNAPTWNEWCSPTLTPSVSTFLQEPMLFWAGETEVYVGYNPATGVYFRGSMYEVWFDPGQGTGN